jgi:hypothetical protein
MNILDSLKILVGKQLPSANSWQATLAIVLNHNGDIPNTIANIAATSLLTEKEVVVTIKELMNAGFRMSKTKAGNLIFTIGDTKYTIDLSKKKQPKETGSMEMFVDDAPSKVEAKAPVGVPKEYECTDNLIKAIISKKYELIDKALGEGDIRYDYTNDDNQSVISAACGKNDMNILTKMVEAGMSAQDGLMWACQNGNAYRGQIPFFIKHGASANESESLMPMQWAIFTGAVGVAQELIENGADLNYISDSGESILQMAVDSDNKQVVELMVINGANLDIVDHDGNTPLHWAVNTGAIDTTRMLLYNKADATKMNNEGKTPRDMAISLGKDRIAKILKKYLA